MSVNNLGVNAVNNSFADYANPFGKNLQSAGGVSRSEGFQLFAVYIYKYIYVIKNELLEAQMFAIDFVSCT